MNLAGWIKCEVYKHKDLSLNPQDSQEGSVLVHICNPSSRVVGDMQIPRPLGCIGWAG